MTHTDEDLANATAAKAFPWHARKKPEVFKPVQLDLKEGESPIPFTPLWLVQVLDWWNTHSLLFCIIYPFLRWFCYLQLVDATDADVWKPQLSNPSNKRCPDSMKGLWWLRYSTAPESLVTIFNDAEFTGTFNAEGTDGYGCWARPLRYNWSRDNALLGLIGAVISNRTTAKVQGFMNLKDGICTVNGRRGKGIQVVYRKTDDEWWKVHYAANPGEEGDQTVEYMYKWIKVLDKDGNKTKHWEEYEQWCATPMPYQNWGTSWWPFWGWFLSGKEIARNMTLPNPKQVVDFRVASADSKTKLFKEN